MPQGPALTAWVGAAFEPLWGDSDDMLAARHRHAADRMTHGVERRGEGIPGRAGLEQNDVFGAAEIDQRSRLCGVEPPLDQRDDGLHVVQNDRRAAWAAEH